jgi:flagellar protein FliO/FliZ
MSLRWLVLLTSLLFAPWARAETVAPAAGPEVVAPAPPAAAAGLEPAKDAELAKPDASPELGPEEYGIGWTLFRTTVVLCLVIALIYLTLNVGLRKLLGIRPQTYGRSVVTVLERVPLDQKRTLFVVRVAGEVLLLGGADVSLQLITRLDAAEVDRQRAETSQPTIQLSPVLQKLLGRKDAAPPPQAPPPTAT